MSMNINDGLHSPITAVGRFGHHPDPAIDFEVEVDSLQAEISNKKLGFECGTPSLEELNSRVTSAMGFIVGGDPSSVDAKATLRELERDLAALDKAEVQP